MRDQVAIAFNYSTHYHDGSGTLAVACTIYMRSLRNRRRLQRLHTSIVLVAMITRDAQQSLVLVPTLAVYEQVSESVRTACHQWYRLRAMQAMTTSQVTVTAMHALN